MGRRKSSARTKSFTPSPAGAPSKKTKTTTLDQFWSQAIPTSKESHQSTPNRRSPNTPQPSSKFASANSFAPLSDDEELDQHQTTSHRVTHYSPRTRPQRQSPRADTVISPRAKTPGPPQSLSTPVAVPGTSLRLPASRTTAQNTPQQQVIDIQKFSSPSTSSTVPPDDIRMLSSTSTSPDIAVSTPERNIQFVEETPSPLSKNQQRLLATAARHLLFIDDASDADSKEEEINPNNSVSHLSEYTPDTTHPTMEEPTTPP